MQRAAALVVLFLLLSVPMPALAQTGSVASVSDVSVSPEQPLPGEQFTVTVTIRNDESASEALDLTEVSIYRDDGREIEGAAIRRLGRIAPGSEMRVPVTLSLSSPGTHDLRIIASGKTPGKFVELRYPVAVTVRSGGPQVSVDVPDDPVVGEESTVRVTASNGDNNLIRNLQVRLAGGNATVRNDTRVVGSLDTGETRVFSFSVTPRVRRTDLTASLQYTTRSGDVRTVRDTAALAADPLSEDVWIEASVPTEGGSPPLVVELSNLGNAPLDNLALSVRADGRAVTRRALDPLPADSKRRIELNVSSVDEATLDVEATYETGGQRGRVRTSIAYAANPGRVVLTGIDYEREGDAIHITGSASNVGLSEVNGVVVSVRESAGVTPARPFREYFVGTVPASDFVSFDLYARVDDGVESIPVEITYLVDGERRTEVRQLDVADLPPPQQNQQSGPSLLPLALGGLAAVVVVAAGGYVLYRRYR